MIHSGVSVSTRISDIEPMLREWTNLVASVSKAFPQTTAAWFVERTLMSLFSSAAWKCAFPSIVEAKARRISETGESRGGHADILVQLPLGRIACEAKVCWYNRSTGAEDSMEPKLHQASRDARCLDPDFAERRLGLSFVVFECGGDRLDELLNHSRERATGLQVDLQAWWLEDAPSSNVRYPGFLVVGRLC